MADTALNDQAALALSKHLAASRESHGDAVVDAALEADAAARSADPVADAGAARAASGQGRSTAPQGRSAGDPKTTSKEA